MRLSPEVNCTGCPKMCCHGLARRGHRFADPSDQPRMCKHCNMMSDFWCRIHNVLVTDSSGCRSYTCHWIWTAMVQMFSLHAHQTPTEEVMAIFRERQYIALHITRLTELLNHPRTHDMMELSDFIQYWENYLFHSASLEICIHVFLNQLNTLMEKYHIWFRVETREYCFLYPQI
jgi:hypothetical protein